DAPRLLQLGHVAQRLAQRAARNRTGREHAGETGIARTRLDEARDRRAIADGLGVRHRDDGRDAPRDGRASAAGDGLLPLFARFAQVHVQIDQPRQDEQPAAVHHFVRAPLAARDGLLAHFLDAAAVENDRPDAVDARRRVHHAAALEEDHATPRHKASVAMRTATPLSTWSITRLRSPSMTSLDSSTPRLTGPGCSTTARSGNSSSVRALRPHTRA